MDGGFSNNVLCLDQMTISVSPFISDADICPMNSEWNWGYRSFAPQQVETILGTLFLYGNSFHVNWHNIKRFINVIFTPDSDKLLSLLTQGYTDTVHFLATRGLIACQLHQNPLVFPHIIRNHERSYSRPRRRIFPLSPHHANRAVSSLAARLGARNSVTISSESESSGLGPVSFYSAETIGAGIGLNMPHCPACQNALLDALHSKLPTMLSDIIMNRHGAQPPPCRRHGTPSALRLCTHFWAASRSSLGSRLSHIYTLGRRVIFSSLLLQLDVFARLVSFLIGLIDPSIWCMNCRRAAANIWDDAMQYLIRLKSCSTVGTNAIDLTSAAGAVQPAVPIDTVHRWTRHTPPQLAFLQRVQSLITASTDSFSDLLCTLNAMRMPVAEECGLELSCCSLPDLQLHQRVASCSGVSDTLLERLQVDPLDVKHPPYKFSIDSEESVIHKERIRSRVPTRKPFFTASDAEDEGSSTA